MRPDDPAPDPLAPRPTPFVDRVLRSVLDDRRAIETEARAWDAEPVALDPALRDAHHVPDPSADFVERATARVLDDRARRGGGDTAIARALAETSGWPSSPDFVDRTLAALRVERSPLRLLRSGPRASAAADRSGTDIDPPAPRRRWLVAAAAAAVLAVTSAAFGLFADGSSGPSVEQAPAVATADPAALPSSLARSPVGFGTLLSRVDERADAGLRFEPIDPLLQLVLDAEESR